MLDLQQTVLPLKFSHTPKFPSTRYQGSKLKLSNWIWEQISNIDFHTCLDAFGGTGSISYRLKQAGKQVTYNDILRFNYHIGFALAANNNKRLSPTDVEILLKRNENIVYPTFIQDNFHDIYFTDSENAWLDQTITNIGQMEDSVLQSLALFALCQSCIIKRPYNLFHRKNLYVRFANVERTFGNKTSWDKPFEEWFQIFIHEANEAVFDNGKTNCSLNCDVFELPVDYDLIYIDTPYIPSHGIGTDYLGFYHFLEGLALYNEWDRYLDHKSKHLRFLPKPNVWTNKREIHSAFDKLFCKYKDSSIVVSYRSDGIPSIDELTKLLKEYKSSVRVAHFGQYKYALSNNEKSEEILLIGQ